MLHNHEKTDHGRRSEIKESFDDSWLAEKMSEAYARELRYFYLIPIRKISFATYIRVRKLPLRSFGSEMLRKPTDREFGKGMHLV